MKNFKELLKVIAKQNHTTPENVLKEMQLAIDAGFDNPDPDIQKQWSKVSHKAERPTPEEVIYHIAMTLAPANRYPH